MSTTARKIDTEEIALRIQDELNDFHVEGLVSTQINNKKSRFINIIRAINHADRIITRDMNLEGTVVVFVPADTTDIVFSQNADFAHEYIESLESQEANLIDSDYYYFTGKDQFLDVISISDRYLYIFDDYPQGGTKPSGRIKKRGANDFFSRQDDLSRTQGTNWLLDPYYDEAREAESVCYFIPDEGRLVLEKKFVSSKFISFQARLMPGLVRLADLKNYDRNATDYNDVYKVKTPHWGMELLVYEALDWLIPLSSPDAKNLVKAQKAEQKIGFENSKPGDSNVVVPHFSWG